LLGMHLSHLPTARHRQQSSLLQFDRLEWFGCIGFTTCRCVGVENPCEVSGRFGGR